MTASYFDSPQLTTATPIQYFIYIFTVGKHSLHVTLRFFATANSTEEYIITTAITGLLPWIQHFSRSEEAGVPEVHV